MEVTLTNEGEGRFKAYIGQNFMTNVVHLGDGSHPWRLAHPYEELRMFKIGKAHWGGPQYETDEDLKDALYRLWLSQPLSGQEKLD